MCSTQGSPLYGNERSSDKQEKGVALSKVASRAEQSRAEQSRRAAIMETQVK
jgi:hypothetical protein